MRIVAALASLVIVGATAACGSSPAAVPQSKVIVVKAPDLALQGCTYLENGKVPPGEPTGVQPHFSSFTPDQPATSALEKIKNHSGVALANGVIIPAGTHLYAGPDTSKAVGTVPSHYAILVAEPVVWTSDSGEKWLAFFVSCGGENPYWASLEQISRDNPRAASSITPLLKNGTLDPIRISYHGFVWNGSRLPFVIGRGELFGPVSN
jgi:hypothetical protein